MKQLLSASTFLLLLTSSLTTTFAQSDADTIRLYRTADQVVQNNKGGTKPTVYPLSDVRVKANGSVVRVFVAGTGTNYALRKFLNKSGTPYDTVSANGAVTAYMAKLPGTVGSTAPTITDYTSGTNTVSTTNVFKLTVENTGATSSTITYGGFTYTLAAGALRTFEQERDPKSGQRNPLLTLVTIPASSTLRVQKFFEQ